MFSFPSSPPVLSNGLCGPRRVRPPAIPGRLDNHLHSYQPSAKPCRSFLSGDPLDAHRFTYLPLSHIQLSHDVGWNDFLAFKYFKFQELRVHISVPDSPTPFEYCQIHLRALDLRGVSADDAGKLTLVDSGPKRTPCSGFYYPRRA